MVCTPDFSQAATISSRWAYSPIPRVMAISSSVFSSRIRFRSLILPITRTPRYSLPHSDLSSRMPRTLYPHSGLARTRSIKLSAARLYPTSSICFWLYPFDRMDRRLKRIAALAAISPMVLKA